MNTFSGKYLRLFSSLFMSLALILATENSFANTAGKVIFAIGKSHVKAVDGSLTRIRRGSTVNSGDTIITSKKGQVQIRMVDNALISVRPGSEFVLEQYKYQEKSKTNGKKEDKSYLKLVKGGFRSVTGHIGQRNKSNYKVQTVVGTIGIRGTDFTAMLCNSDCGERNKGAGPKIDNGLYVGVISGGVSLKNETGESPLASQQYAHVANARSTPKRLPNPPSFLLFDRTKAEKSDKEKNKNKSNSKKSKSAKQKKEGNEKSSEKKKSQKKDGKKENKDTTKNEKSDKDSDGKSTGKSEEKSKEKSEDKTEMKSESEESESDSNEEKEEKTDTDKQQSDENENSDAETASEKSTDENEETDENSKQSQSKSEDSPSDSDEGTGTGSENNAESESKEDSAGNVADATNESSSDATTAENSENNSNNTVEETESTLDTVDNTESQSADEQAQSSDETSLQNDTFQAGEDSSGPTESESTSTSLQQDAGNSLDNLVEGRIDSLDDQEMSADLVASPETSVGIITTEETSSEETTVVEITESISDIAPTETIISDTVTETTVEESVDVINSQTLIISRTDSTFLSGRNTAQNNDVSVNEIAIDNELQSIKNRETNIEGVKTLVTIDTGTALVKNFGGDPNTGLNWGRWSEGEIIQTLDGLEELGAQSSVLNNDSVHWIVGQQNNEALVMPKTGSATYDLIGNTDPTDNYGNSGVLGSANVFANFETGTVDTNLEIGINNQVWQAQESNIPLNANGSFTTDNLQVTISDTVSGITSGGTGSADGQLVQPIEATTNIPTGAALGYHLQGSPNQVSTQVSGVAAFERKN